MLKHKTIIFYEFLRIKAENQNLQRQLEEEEEQRQQQQQNPKVFTFEVRQPDEPKRHRFTVDDLRIAGISGAMGKSPTTSTPSSHGSKGAIRKNTYFDRNKSISGVFSPIRGDTSAPAGSFYPMTPRFQNRGLILDEQEKEEEEESKVKEEEDDDNHKEAVQGAESADLLMLTGPSVLGQTEEEDEVEETTEKKIRFQFVNVENEVDPIELLDNETVPRRTRSLSRTHKRKPDNPKKGGRKF